MIRDDGILIPRVLLPLLVVGLIAVVLFPVYMLASPPPGTTLVASQATTPTAATVSQERLLTALARIEAMPAAAPPVQIAPASTPLVATNPAPPAAPTPVPPPVQAVEPTGRSAATGNAVGRIPTRPLADPPRDPAPRAATRPPASTDPPTIIRVTDTAAPTAGLPGLPIGTLLAVASQGVLATTQPAVELTPRPSSTATSLSILAVLSSVPLHADASSSRSATSTAMGTATATPASTTPSRTPAATVTPAPSLTPSANLTPNIMATLMSIFPGGTPRNSAGGTAAPMPMGPTPSSTPLPYVTATPPYPFY